MTPAVLGLVVNPVAGMGGRVGLHGTDDSTVELARERGAVPVAPARAMRALARLHDLAPWLTVIAAGGGMGADLLEGSDWDVTALPVPPGDTDAGGTRDAVTAMVAGTRQALDDVCRELGLA